MLQRVDRVPHLDQRIFDHGNASERARFCEELARGLEGTGFVTLEGHGIDRCSVERAYRAARDFFALDEARKARCGGSAGGARGFTPFGVEHAKDRAIADLKEFFHVGQEWNDSHPRASEYPTNRWPAELPELRSSALRLFAELEACAVRLLIALAQAYGLPEDCFAEMLREGNSLMRLAHYPPLLDDTPPGALRAAPHEDINLITLVCEASDSGLEILTPSGWLPVAARSGELVVDAGDMLSHTTGGAIPSTTHRVVNPTPGSEAAARSRYSIPFFAHPAPECDLSVLPRFATPERLRSFPPITAGEFLDQRLREIGLANG